METFRLLKIGATGADVERLQTKLMHWGLFDAPAIDGIFGPITLEAVRSFQRKKQLADDGIVGAATWAELYRLKPEEVQVVERKEWITLPQARAIFGRSPTQEQLDDLNDCLERFEITTLPRMRHFLAQIAHESGGLKWMLELASGWAYEGRRDLGNTQPGDGPKFKGAGFLQLTGRANYQAFATFIGDPKVVEIGAQYVAARYPASSAGYWWHLNRMNALVDSGASCRQVSARVNGADPANGLSDRLQYYSIACAVLK